MTEVLLHGLRVASDIALRSGTPDAGAPDVRFVGEPVAAVPDEAPPGRLIGTMDSYDGTPFRAISEHAGRWYLRFFRRCDVVIEPAFDVVRYRPDPRIDVELLPIYLTGTVLAVVSMLRGHPVLHASAVELGGRAVAFVGASGMGKSTLATAFCAKGAALITDDVLRVDLDSDPPRCRLGATETRLRDAALAVLRDSPDVRAVSADGRHLNVPERRASDLVPLHAIVVPSLRRDEQHVSAQRIRGATALLQLASFPRVVGWDDARTNREHFEFLGQLLTTVPVYDVVLPWQTPLALHLVSEVARALGLDRSRLGDPTG